MDITRMGKTPEKPKKPKKMTAKEQSARFIQTARELKSDESGSAFEKTFQKIVVNRSHKSWRAYFSLLEMQNYILSD